MINDNKQDYLDTSSNYATGINDLQFEKNIKEQKLKQRQEDLVFEKLEKKEARKEKIKNYKQNSIPIYKMKKAFVLTTFLCFILSVVALFHGFMSEAIFVFISGIATLILGQNLRIGNTQPKLTNTILYNLSKSIKDFIDYKIPYEIFDNEKTWMDMYTVLGMIVFLFIPSKNIFYALCVLMLFLVFIIAFANNDIESIYSHTKLLVPICFIGVIVKVITQYLYMGVIDVDMANIVLINLFAIINVFTKDLTITKPQY